MENTSSMEFLLLQEVQFLDVNDADLPQWEFVDVLDTEEGPEEDEVCETVPKRTGSWASSISSAVPPKADPIGGLRCLIIRSDDPSLKTCRSDFEFDDSYGDRRLENVEDEIDGLQSGDGDAGGYGDDEDVDDYNGHDLDDELVPWSVNSKFERQRMRKLGKRAFSKMNNSKRSPYLFVRPGCVRGKHGLGLKHNY